MLMGKNDEIEVSIKSVWIRRKKFVFMCVRACVCVLEEFIDNHTDFRNLDSWLLSPNFTLTNSTNTFAISDHFIAVLH